MVCLDRWEVETVFDMLPSPESRESLMVASEPTSLDLRRLYDEYRDLVRRAVIRLGGPRQDAEDLIHEVFVIAAARLGTFRGESQPSTWLYGICVKVVCHARRKERWLGLFQRGETPELPTYDSPHRHFEQREAAEICYRILNQLSEKKRTVFVLFELEQLTGEEIAIALDCPLKTVWTRLHHARKEFVQHLERSGVRS